MYIKKIEILIYNLIQFFFSNNVQNTIANIINNSEFSSHIKKIIFDVGSYKGDWSLKMEKSFFYGCQV